jgi:predicted MFS family arabinose efflux permease
MMNHHLSFAPIGHRGRLLAATAFIAVLAMAMTVLPARAASAAPSAAYVAGSINSGFSQTGYPVGADCTATVGGWLNYPRFTGMLMR